jgi:hypothetical protein
MSILPLKRLKAVLEAAAKDGIYVDGELFEIEPETSLKLMSDRAILLDAAKRVLARVPPHSPSALMLKNAIEQAEAGWPNGQDGP